VFIHETATVEPGVELGENSKIWHHAHVRRGAKIGNDCILGKGVYIDLEVVVGDRCKLQNRVSVYHGVTIEDDVFVGPHVTFTNDLFPRAFNEEWETIPTLVKKGASISAGSVILCGIELGKFCLIGAGSVVTKDVPNYALVYGNPARIHGIVCECGVPITPLPIIKKIRKQTVELQCSKCGTKIVVESATLKSIPT
jgi:acetyltransferase-like isoleucine patch superfamily enzyme